MNATARLARAVVDSRPARRLFLDRQLELWLGALDGASSLREPRARVEQVIAETHDTRSFVLRPNRLWRGHRAGQHTVISVEIDGVRARRCYTISSAPGRGPITITVKRAGRVSSWLHDRVRPGDVLGLSPAAGDFVLPRPCLGKLLFLSGGSGITPLMSMLRGLAAGQAVGDVAFVTFVRSERDVIFGDELRALAARHPRLRLHVATGPFDGERLATLLPDLAERETFLCGPPAMMARVDELFATRAHSRPVHRERFVAQVTVPAGLGAQRLTLARSGRAVEAPAGATLLAALEAGGASPPSGCRMGICGTCRTRKISGAVVDTVTGAISAEPDEEIRLCTSAPCSPVELAL